MKKILAATIVLLSLCISSAIVSAEPVVEEVTIDPAEPEVLENKTYHFEGTISSSSFTPSNVVGMALGGLAGAPAMAYHEFNVPDDYKYARINIHAENFVDEDVEETPD